MSEVEQIRRLLAHYCHLLDDRRYVEFGLLFAADGVWELGGRKNHGPVEVKAYMDRLLINHPGRRTKHLCTNVAIELDGGSASVTSDYVMLAREGQGAWVVASGGRYVDRLERQASGEWRFAHRRLA